MADPTTTIVAEIVARLDERGFRPFAIMLSDGSRYDIPSRDHCTVTRLLREYRGSRFSATLLVCGSIRC
ncbi:MAG: hypothetical protein ABIZ49_01620 [Opitutaceae bacterium]